MRKVLGVLLGLALVLPATAAFAEHEAGDRTMTVDKAPVVYVAPAASGAADSQTFNRGGNDDRF